MVVTTRSQTTGAGPKLNHSNTRRHKKPKAEHRKPKADKKSHTTSIVDPVAPVLGIPELVDPVAQVLGIPELINIIVKNLDDRDQYALAKTSSSLFEMAVQVSRSMLTYNKATI